MLLDDATRLATRARAAGIATRLEVWPEMIHVWQNFAAILPEARQAIEEIGSSSANTSMRGLDANANKSGSCPQDNSITPHLCR